MQQSCESARCSTVDAACFGVSARDRCLVVMRNLRATFTQEAMRDCGDREQQQVRRYPRARLMLLQGSVQFKVRAVT